MAVLTARRDASSPSSVRDLALTALTPLTWGSTYAVTTEFLPPGRPMFTAMTRALPAGLALLAATRVLPRGAWWWRAAVLGVLNIGAFFPLLFLAAYRLPGGVAAVLGAVGPLFALAFAALLLAERPTARKLLAALTGLAGVGLVVLRADARMDVLGVLAGLAGAASMAAGTVLTKRWGRPEGVGPLGLTAWQLTVGGLLLVPVTLLVEGPPPALDGRAVGGYLYLGAVGTAAAYWVWFRGLSRLPATSVAFLPLLSPLSAAVIGWAALGQALTPLQLLGMTLAFGGTLAGQWSGGRRREAVPAPPAPSTPPAVTARRSS
ncbi:EamA family transporter [Actinoallomurus rhizosphaericola]|uniref:EamA family transporter n=1 Tax=Actinoallomurus rhizosphaericola TaxID=2952536 RepID=UPI002091C77F|nr:EamA family transporter [Actinoallomurus rhizosphaericola]MCO5994206.1 EamA family transporter [Actinoallomurus rhizosphaericola]